ncbi:hypothetical protein I592_02058 [Enterococcus gilvus ATCC BAA-350]|uniref:Uncharacterized protein n=1 Tax=Enterococcus gilvus ATCC BAA-350 TaxID=1158614 RepID=R2Y143_9ENTE|nr:hypothetical protein UKC_01909 [Enterococcus gilvus ATCC BAA-350]EOW82738.1 hypothetical protein I592_02058 [Enterococcus gilvus ATCC BAA-350]
MKKITGLVMALSALFIFAAEVAITLQTRLMRNQRIS